MSEPVTELFAELGFKVDQNALAQAESGLQTIVSWAQRAINAVSGVGGALARAGAPGGGRATSALPQIPEHVGSGRYQDDSGRWREASGRFVKGGRKGMAEHELPPAGGAKDPHGVAGAAHEAHAATRHAAGAAKGLTGLLEHATHVAHGFLGLFAAHQIQHFAHEMMEAASQAEHTAKKLGLTTDAVQQLQFAANMQDIDKGALNTGLKFLQLNSTKASEGSKEAAKAFRGLGVSVKDATGGPVPLDELFENVATKIAEIKDPAKQTTVAVQLFGRSGQELIPLLQKGGEGIREFREEAEALGGGLTEALLEDAGKYEEALKRFEFAFIGVKSAIGNFLLPILTKLSQGLTFLVGKFNEIYKKTKFFQTLITVGLYAALAKLVLWLNTVGAAGVLAWAKSVGGFILLAAVIAGVALVLEDLYRGLTGGKSAIGKWVDQWQGLGTTSEFVKSIAAGLDTITAALERMVKSPGMAALEGLKSITHENSALGQYMLKNGVAKKGEFRSTVDTNAADEERANRAVANGRGSRADARGNIDIPRATERGTNGKADAAFGQAKASALGGAAGANNDSVVNITVHAPGGDGKDIAHHVEHALEKHEAKRNRKLRHALVPTQDE